MRENGEQQVLVVYSKDERYNAAVRVSSLSISIQNNAKPSLFPRCLRKVDVYLISVLLRTVGDPYRRLQSSYSKPPL